MAFDNSQFGVSEEDLPRGWRADRLDAVASFNPEQIATDYPYAEIFYLDISNVAAGEIGSPEKLSLADAPSRAKRVVRPHDSILSTVRPGNRAYAFLQDVPQNLIVSTGFAVMRAKPSKADPRFLYYLATSGPLIDYLASIADEKTAYPSVNPSDIAECILPIPPLTEQHAIASVLGALDDKIELNRRANETLEELAQSVFKSWFVDATQTALPEGWREGTLGEITGFLGGYAFKSKDWMEQGVPVVKIGSVKPGIVDLSEVSYVSDEIAAEAKRFRLSAGDLLIGMTGYVGEVGLVPPTDNPPLLNQRVGKFVLEKPGTPVLGFLYCLARRPEFKAAVEVKSHGTAQANVSAEGILSVPINVPPPQLIDDFNAFCEPILKQMLANHGESRALAALRDALLPKLLSGELRVGPVEK